MQQNKLSQAIEIGLVGDKGGKTPRAAVESPDTLRSIAVARIVDAVSEGEIEGFVHGNDPAQFLRDVYFNETPVQNADGSRNFKTVTVDARMGTQDQSYIPGFPSVENEIGIGVVLTSSTPWTRSFTNQALSAVRVRLAVAALSKTDTTNGDIKGYNISYAIDVATDGGAFVEVHRNAFNGKSTGPYERSHRIDLPPATVSGWILRVRRLTADDATVYVQDDTSVVSVTEIIDGKFRYPLTALVGVQIDASQFQSIPTRGYHLRGRRIRVPTNYNPVTGVYATAGAGTSGGTWDGTFKTAYSNNPAWVFYDLMTHRRYGLGKLVQELRIDKWTLYSISQYCDEIVPNGFGGTERRMTCNLYLQKKGDAYKVMSDLSSIFRGMAYWANGVVVPVADKPTDPVYTYTNGNVVDGTFVYSSTGRRARHTAVLVSYTDMENFGKLATDYYDYPPGIKRYGFQLLEMVAMGCTSRGQAQRLAKWALLSENVLTNLCTWTVGMDGTFALPGQVVRIADKYRAGRRIGGRVTSATTSAVVLDAIAVVPPAPGDSLTIILPTGVSQTRIVNSVNVGTRTVGVSVPFSAAPLPESVWAVDSSAINTQLFRCLSITPTDGGGHQLQALQYNPSLFDAVDLGEPIVIPPTSIVAGSSQLRPASVTITSVERAGTVLAMPLLTAKWPATVGASKYRVQWQKDNGNWSAVQEVDGLAADYDTPFPGSYVCKVSAVNALGIVSVPQVSAAFVLADQTLTPTTVQDLQDDMFDALAAIAAAEDAIDGVVEIFIQNAPPAHPPAKLGDLWFDLDDGNKQYRSNGTTWVVVTDTRVGDALLAAAGAQATADSKIRVFYAAASSPPTATAIGDLWYVTDQASLKRWSGSAWVLIADNAAESLNDYVSNAKFEMGNPPPYWTLQTGWRLANGAGDAFQGTYALCSDPAISTTDSRAYCDKQFSVEAGEVYIVSAMVRPLNNPNGTFGIGLYFLDAAGAFIGVGEDPKTRANWGLTAGVYKKIAQRVVVPAGAKKAFMSCVRFGHTSDYWLIDNVSVTKMPSNLDDVLDSPTYGRVRSVTLYNGVQIGLADGNNLVPNGSFSRRSASLPVNTAYNTAGNYLYDDWRIENAGLYSYVYNENNTISNLLFRIDQGASYPASAAYNPVSMVSAPFDVIGGRNYVASMFYSNGRNATPTAGWDGLFRILVQWLAADGSDLGSSNYVDFALLTLAGDTRWYRDGFNSPAGAKRARVFLQQYSRNTSGSPVAPAGSLWSDFRVGQIGLYLAANMDTDVEHGTTYGKPANADLYDSSGVRRIGLRIGTSGQRIGSQRNTIQVNAQNVASTGKLTANSSGQVSIVAHNALYGGFSVAYSAVANAITGLTQNVTYVIYCVDADYSGGTRTWFAGTNPAAVAALGDDVYIAGQIKIPTSGTGTGGGGGGGSNPGDWCVAADSYMPDGSLAVDNLPGMMLPCYNNQPDTPNIRHQIIQKNDSAMADCVRLVTRSGATIVASKSTPMTLRNNVCVPITSMLGHDALVYRLDGSFTWDPVVEVQEAGERLVSKIVVHQQCYFAGESMDAFIATHNVLQYKP